MVLTKAITATTANAITTTMLIPKTNDSVSIFYFSYMSKNNSLL